MTTAVLAARKLLQQGGYRALLLMLAAGGLVMLGAFLSRAVAHAPALEAALLAAAFTALATGAGALPVLFVGRTSLRGQSVMLGFSGGIMLAAAAFSLALRVIDTVLESNTQLIANAKALPGLQISTAAIVTGGIVIGAGTMLLIDQWLPHAHTADGAAHRPGDMARVWLVVLAIALHNVPEGLAVGVAHASGAAQGTAVTLGIAAQNLPEGLIVAWAMRTLNYSRANSVLIALATGLMEPIGALIGVMLVGLSAALLPWGLAFAAGAMIFVVSHEIIPESHRHGHEGHATAGVTAGFVSMLLLAGALA